MTSPPTRPNVRVSTGSLSLESREQIYDGPTRHVRIPNASGGGGRLSKSEDLTRCVIAGRESLRVARLSVPGHPVGHEHRSATGAGGHRVELSRNMWPGSGLKADSVTTDVVWLHGTFNNKLVTSCRNGEVIIWDLNKSGHNKIELRKKDHARSINGLARSEIMHYYFATGSADGDLRFWDIRDMGKGSKTRLRHPSSIRAVALSPSTSNPMQAIVGLDSGGIYRWDMRMGQRGPIDRLTNAHSAAVLALDWCVSGGNKHHEHGWLASASMDCTVKVWDLNDGYTSQSAPVAQSLPPMHRDARFVLHTAWPVNRVLWCPNYSTDLAISSHHRNVDGSLAAENIEIWDARRAWIAKWEVTGSAIEGGVTGMTFADSHALWTQHTSGAFSQLDLRQATRPLDTIPRQSIAWDATDSFLFASDQQKQSDGFLSDVLRPENLDISLGRSTSFSPLLQNIGRIGPIVFDRNSFSKLASGYVFHGESKLDICRANAQVAWKAGECQIAETWSLICSLLEELPESLPPTPPESPKREVTSLLPDTPGYGKSLSPYSSPYGTRPPSTRSSPHPAAIPLPAVGIDELASEYGQRSGASSNTSSPLKHSVNLPILPLLPAGRPPNVVRRTSYAVPVSKTSRPPFRRASISVPHSISSRSDSNPQLSAMGSVSELQKIGEGTLADSSSSSDNADSEYSEGNDLPSAEILHPETQSPALPFRSGIVSTAVTSPLSQSHAPGSDGGWASDENEGSRGSGYSSSDELVSPASPIIPIRNPLVHSGSHSRRTKRTRPRGMSKSSTIASFPAPASLSPAPVTPSSKDLSKQTSFNSIRTVTAKEESMLLTPQEFETKLPSENQDKERRTVDSPFTIDDPVVLGTRTTEVDHDQALSRRLPSDRRLKTAFQFFEESGDVQMCAALALVVPNELGITQHRRSRLAIAYLDLLSRLQLHVAAARIRKHMDTERTRASVSTRSSYTLVCGQCRKPIRRPKSTLNGLSHMTVPSCPSCKRTSAKCSICHLPARTLFIACPICSHGGHQECLSKYYSEQPVVDVPNISAIPLRGHILTRKISSPMSNSLEDTQDTDVDGSDYFDQHRRLPNKLRGHPCAAGCGHLCWIASEKQTLQN